MDRKTRSKHQTKRGRARGGSQRTSVNSTSIMQLSNGMTYATRWEFGSVASGTTGQIAVSTINPSIVNTSEYSTITSLFSEVRLLRCQVIFTPALPSTSSNVGRVMIGTQMQANSSVPGTVTSITQVQNLARVTFMTVGAPSQRPLVYNMPVPRGLEFASITADAPSPVTPFAGSPGCVYLWADGLTNSNTYLKVDVIALYQCRGRV